MIIEVKKEGVYIPTWKKNNELPETEQIRVTHRYFAPEERKKYIYTTPMQANKLTGAVGWDVQYIQDEKGITKALVTGIENLTIMSGKKKIEIKTAEEMYKTEGVPAGLVSDIESGMLIASPEVDKDFL